PVYLGARRRSQLLQLAWALREPPRERTTSRPAFGTPSRFAVGHGGEICGTYSCLYFARVRLLGNGCLRIGAALARCRVARLGPTGSDRRSRRGTPTTALTRPRRPRPARPSSSSLPSSAGGSRRGRDPGPPRPRRV